MPRFVVFEHFIATGRTCKCAVDADQVTAIVPHGLYPDQQTFIYWAGAQVVVKGSFDEVFAALMKWQVVIKNP